MAERVVVDQIDFRSALVFPRVLNSGALSEERGRDLDTLSSS